MKPRRSSVAQPVVDVDLDIVATGQTSTAASAQIATGQSGPGYLIIANPDLANPIYLDGVTADATKFPLLPQQTLTFRLADVASPRGYSSTGILAGWMVLR
jgi:hypothetical protein